MSSARCLTISHAAGASQAVALVGSSPRAASPRTSGHTPNGLEPQRLVAIRQRRLHFADYRAPPAASGPRRLQRRIQPDCLVILLAASRTRLFPASHSAVAKSVD